MQSVEPPTVPWLTQYDRKRLVARSMYMPSKSWIHAIQGWMKYVVALIPSVVALKSNLVLKPQSKGLSGPNDSNFLNLIFTGAS